MKPSSNHWGFGETFFVLTADLELITTTNATNVMSDDSRQTQHMLHMDIASQRENTSEPEGGKS